LFLASSVFFALKAAVEAARVDNNVAGYVPLFSPATTERIRMACMDKLAKLYTKDRHNKDKDGGDEYRPRGSW